MRYPRQDKAMKVAGAIFMLCGLFLLHFLPSLGKPTILVVVSNCKERKVFAQICSGSSGNAVRGCDSCGCGHYGASRNSGKRTHTGIDLACPPGSSVYAPFPAKVVRVARPYGNGKPHDTGVLLQGTGSWSEYQAKLFYFKKTAGNGSNVTSGDILGTMSNMAAQYKCGMTNHIHVRLYKNGRTINPTAYAISAANGLL